MSDLDQTLKGLRLLRQRGHDVMVFHVMDDDELDFPFTGPTRFEGLELPDAFNCNPRALRDGYLEALEQFLRRCAAQAAPDSAIDYALIRTSEPLDAALAKFLSIDLAMRRIRITHRHLKHPYDRLPSPSVDRPHAVPLPTTDLGFLLVLLPLLIHLINLMRQRRVKWAAMEFLLQRTANTASGSG